VVVTAGALEALTAQQLALVLGHERAHLPAHHELPLVLADTLRRTFGLPVFATALEQIAILAEMPQGRFEQAPDNEDQEGLRVPQR